MGSDPDIQRVQHRSLSMLRHLFRALPHHGDEAAQIRHTVSSSSKKIAHIPFQLPLSAFTGTLWGSSETTCARPQARSRQLAASRPISHASFTTSRVMGVGVAHSGDAEWSAIRDAF